MVSESWRKTLYIMFGAELVVITAFSFVQPFLAALHSETG